MADNLQRRQYVRTAVSLPVQFTIEGNGPRLEGAIVDLGEGGMRLVSEKHAPARSSIKLSFKLPRGVQEIRARGRVVLSYYSAPEQKYHHGVAFTSIDKDDRAAIGHFVAAQVTHP
jgi:c-di-GMP-binding flagellar brake protein YcgR